jgi:hypothetical protein
VGVVWHVRLIGQGTSIDNEEEVSSRI